MSVQLNLTLAKLENEKVRRSKGQLPAIMLTIKAILSAKHHTYHVLHVA